MATVEPWNKGLTKKTSPILANIAKQKSDWWKNNDTTTTRARIGAKSKGQSWKGVLNPRWKGGQFSSQRDKYVYVLSPDHPRATKNGYVLEHRLAMEAQLGRHLLPYEDVHHANGDKRDNRIENLKLVSHNNHFDHHQCPQCGFRFETK